MTQRKPHLIPAVVVAFLLLIAALPLPYGYYTFLRWATCGAAAFIAYSSSQWKVTWALWIFISIAVLFNPVVPIHLTKEIWQPIDIASAIIFSISAFVLKKPLTD